MPSKDYKFKREIGRGQYGEALLYVNKKDKISYVVKKMDVSDPELKKAATTEFRLLSALSNPYIVAYKESWIDMPHLYIVMEYCEGGDLAALIKKQAASAKYLPEDQIQQWTLEICLGLEHVHSQNIIHRDLKPQNIFLTLQKHIKIGDFGISRQIQPGILANTCIGTPLYLSPEIFAGRSYDGRTDVWSLGCCVREMMCLHTAIDANVLLHSRDLVIQPITEGGYSRELISLTELMLTRDESQRPTVTDILRTDFMMTVRTKIEQSEKNVGVSPSDIVSPSIIGRFQTLFKFPPRPPSSSLPDDPDSQNHDNGKSIFYRTLSDDSKLSGCIKLTREDSIRRSGQEVRGLAILDGDLYAAQKFSPTIVVYDRNLKSPKNQFDVDGLTNPCDMAACPLNDCLYITEYMTKKVFKVGKDGRTLRVWSTDGRPDGVSVTPESTIIVALRDVNRLSEFDRDGAELARIDIVAPDVRQPRHAVRLPSGNLVLSYGFSLGQKGLCLLNAVGDVVLRYDPPSDVADRYSPVHLAANFRGDVFVADFHNDVVGLHDADLSRVGELINARTGSSKPFRMAIDESVSRRLYVGMFADSFVVVAFKIEDAVDAAAVSSPSKDT